MKKYKFYLAEYENLHNKDVVIVVVGSTLMVSSWFTHNPELCLTGLTLIMLSTISTVRIEEVIE